MPSGIGTVSISGSDPRLKSVMIDVPSAPLFAGMIGCQNCSATGSFASLDQPRGLNTGQRTAPHGELFVDVQDCKTPEEVIVALSLAGQPYGNLASKIGEAFSSFWQGFRDNVESVGTSELLELRFREGIAGDWRAKAGKIDPILGRVPSGIYILTERHK